METTVFRTGVEITLVGRGRTKDLKVTGCKEVCRVTHHSPLNIGTMCTCLNKGRGTLLDTREGWALGSPAVYVIEELVKGEWVRVGEGTWRTEVMEKPIDLTAFPKDFEKFKELYQRALSPVTKRVGGKPRRLTSLIFPTFLVSDFFPDGYLMPGMNRLEFAVFTLAKKLVTVPGLPAAGMCAEGASLLLQDMCRVVVFEDHLAPRKILCYLAGDTRFAACFSEHVLTFLNGEGKKVFAEFMRHTFEDKEVRRAQLGLCHCDQLFDQRDNGREQSKPLEYFQLHVLCSLVLHLAGFRSMEEREQVFAIVKVGDHTIDTEMLKGIESAAQFRGKFVILYAREHYVPVAHRTSFFGKLMQLIINDEDRYLSVEKREGLDISPALSLCITAQAPTHVQRRQPCPSEYLLDDWQFTAPELSAQPEPLPENKVMRDIAERNGPTQNIMAATVEGLNSKPTSLLVCNDNTMAKNNNNNGPPSHDLLSFNNDGQVASLAVVSNANNNEAQASVPSSAVAVAVEVEVAVALAQTTEAPAKSKSRGGRRKQAQRAWRRTAALTGSANDETVDVIEGISEQALTRVLTNSPDGSSRAADSVAAPLPTQEVSNNEPTAPLMSLLESGASAMPTPPTAPTSTSTISSELLVVVNEAAVSSQPTGEESVDVAPPAPSPVQEEALVTVQAAPLLLHGPSIDHIHTAHGPVIVMNSMDALASASGSAANNPISPMQHASSCSASGSEAPLHNTITGDGLDRGGMVMGMGMSGPTDSSTSSSSSMASEAPLVASASSSSSLAMVGATQAVPTPPVQDSAIIINNIMDNNHVALTITNVTDTPQVDEPQSGEEEGSAPAHVVIDMEDVPGAARPEDQEGCWSWVWSSVQNAWVYVCSCAYGAAMAVVSWFSPSYWMGSGEGEEGVNSAEAWV